MKLTPEIVLIDDETSARLADLVEAEIRRIEMFLDENPFAASEAASHGWTPRAMAWGRVISALDPTGERDDTAGDPHDHRH